LRQVADGLAAKGSVPAGLGITGQQHGGLLVGADLTPRTPFINWQDRRADQEQPGTGRTFVQEAVELAGPDAPQRTGCTLAAGYLGVTLFWMKETGSLPLEGTACFLTDYFAALLTGGRPFTDPTCAASSGLFDVRRGEWDEGLLAALGLPRTLLPEVRPSGQRLGGLTPEMADRTGLPAGLPVSVGIGDNQASFLGAVAHPADTVLVNVGTGGQVAVHSAGFHQDALLETRPFPGGGYLLVCAGLSGGRAYSVLESFFRQVGAQLFNVPADQPLYPRLNALAAGVPPGAGGLNCEPFFTGTRHRPGLRASWTGLAAETFTPGHLARSLLEGMARAFRKGYDAIVRQTDRPARRLVGAGNGMRENPLLARIVAGEMGLPLEVPRHREEAANGAALLAAVGVGAFPDLRSAGRLIQYARIEA
jgi:sugar (pentulose or hexulose) kinase